MFDIRSRELALTCPKCQHQTVKTIGWIESNAAFVCDACGTEIALNKEGFENVAKVDEALGNLSDAANRLRRIQ